LPCRALHLGSGTDEYRAALGGRGSGEKILKNVSKFKNNSVNLTRVCLTKFDVFFRKVSMALRFVSLFSHGRSTMMPSHRQSQVTILCKREVGCWRKNDHNRSSLSRFNTAIQSMHVYVPPDFCEPSNLEQRQQSFWTVRFDMGHVLQC